MRQDELIQRKDRAVREGQQAPMWPYYPDLLAVPVPRYTSFPTAAEFHDVEPAAYHTALMDVEGDVSLYVHIPFCEKICFYCGCNTGAVGRRQRLESYLSALHLEITQVAALLPAGVRVRRIAFGGGSPNALGTVDFLRLVEHLTARFPIVDPVYSIELDPRAMTADWADAIGSVGIQRASLGVQTFAAHCQQAIGRVQSEDMILRSVDWVRGAGVASLNFDLMYGLPQQTGDDLRDTLHRSRVLGADRIALFGYAHVPHIVPRQRAIDDSNLPDQADRFAMADMGYSYLCTHGYVPVGFDHFAKPGGDPLAHAAMDGTLHRNFQGFTDDGSAVLIGLGSSAISSFPDLLIQNEKNSGRYRMLVSRGQLAGTRGIRRTADDRIRARVIEQLLCHGRSAMPPDLIEAARCSLAPFTDRGLASIDGVHLNILPDGLPYARTIAALFDHYRHPLSDRFSSAV